MRSLSASLVHFFCLSCAPHCLAVACPNRTFGTKKDLARVLRLSQHVPHCIIPGVASSLGRQVLDWLSIVHMSPEGVEVCSPVLGGDRYGEVASAEVGRCVGRCVAVRAMVKGGGCVWGGGRRVSVLCRWGSGVGVGVG